MKKETRELQENVAGGKEDGEDRNENKELRSLSQTSPPAPSSMGGLTWSGGGEPANTEAYADLGKMQSRERLPR